MATLDESFGRIVEEELRGHGVRVVSGVTVERIELAGAAHSLVVSGSNNYEAKVELVLVAAGVQPNTGLAQATGI